jgi:NADPH-dependent 2,4-dienoyl-CoA reductase/sulfur reductase-like enzyme
VISDLPGVHHLRTLDDACRLRERLAPGSRLAIVGAGLIGAEVASTALGQGIRPTLIEAAPAPLGRAFGGEIGALLAERWRAAGADVRTEARVCGARLGRRGVAALRFDDGTSLECDQVLVAIGAVPVTSLVAYQLSLAADGGIATDACGRTSEPGVFACGDVASWHRQVLEAGVRAENWSSAAYQAAVVARTILGKPAPASDVPLYAWSDQFGLRLQHVSTGATWERVEIEHGTDAGLVANRPREAARLRRELAAMPPVAA